MKITLVRHSEVIKEYQGRYNGHIDIPLSKKGKKDAHLLAKQLQSIPFDIVYCSDLSRAKETLEIISPRAEVIFTPQLREKSWGKHEGMSFEEIENSGIKYENFTQWIDALDGEGTKEFVQRVKSYFYDVILSGDTQNVLVVTHSGVIKTVLSFTKKISLERAFTTELPYSSVVQIDTEEF